MIPFRNAVAGMEPGAQLRTRAAGRQGSPLPEGVRRIAEELLGEDLSQVRVHVSDAPRRMRAIAFTSGSDICFAPGRYDPGSPEGLRLLGHELTHVVQQRRGRVRNPHGYGVAVVQDAGLEDEADRMGQALEAAWQEAASRPRAEADWRRQAAQAAQQPPPARLPPAARPRARSARPSPAPTDVPRRETAPSKGRSQPAPAARAKTRGAPVQRAQEPNIQFVRGRIACPWVYQDAFVPNDYVVRDYASPDDFPQLVPVNRMCNAMAILWAMNDGADGNRGFWNYSANDQLLMARWVVADVTPLQQAQRVENELDAAEIGVDNFPVVLANLNGTDARGVLSTNAHSVAYVVRNGRVRVYDPLDGTVTYDETVAAFARNFPTYAAAEGWVAAFIHQIVPGEDDEDD